MMNLVPWKQKSRKNATFLKKMKPANLPNPTVFKDRELQLSHYGLGSSRDNIQLEHQLASSKKANVKPEHLLVKVEAWSSQQ